MYLQFGQHYTVDMDEMALFNSNGGSVEAESSHITDEINCFVFSCLKGGMFSDYTIIWVVSGFI